MFKEVVFSTAIILGFFLNLFFVEHPNVTSYTITFIISMVIISPVAVWWKFRSILLARRAEQTGEEEDFDQVSVGALVVSDAMSFVAPITGKKLNSSAQTDVDVEKGGVKVVVVVVVESVGPEGS
jgi:hypothetical protein